LVSLGVGLLARCNIVIAIALLAVACSVDKRTIKVAAHPGNFNVQTLGSASSTGTLSVSMRLVAFNGEEAWPPAAYAGFYQGADRSNSVQFLIIRNHESDQYLVVGYRVIEAGREIKFESLSNVPLDATVHANLKIDNGLFTLRLNDTSPITIRTPLAEVAPYVSVSSGTADFTIDH
jgi:hypothetical protein